MIDDMEHDQDLDGGSAPGSEGEYMYETSEDNRGFEKCYRCYGEWCIQLSRIST